MPYSLIHLLTFVKPLRGFTMAEILLSLTIIGVVAAITLPSLMANINERTWNTQRKALYARMSQAIAIMPSLNGYGTLTEDADGNVTEDTAAEAFLTEGLSKVLKINNICDSEHLADCGIPTSYTNLAGTVSAIPTKLSELNNKMVNGDFIDTNSSQHTYSQADLAAAAFETQNGESILAFYNPRCEEADGETTHHYAQNKICANFIYDMNGNKGPNTVGKDIGAITVLYPIGKSVVAPYPLAKEASQGISHIDALAACKNMDSESRIPNYDETLGLFINRKLFGMNSTIYWSGSLEFSADGSKAWGTDFSTGRPGKYARTSQWWLHCVKR